MDREIVLKRTCDRGVRAPGSLQALKGKATKGRPEYVIYVLARIISSNLQYQAAAGIGAMCAGHMAVT